MEVSFNKRKGHTNAQGGSGGRQRLEGSVYKPGNAKGGGQIAEVR